MDDSRFGNLQVEWLEAFVAVATFGKRTAAAQSIGRDQATVTKFLNKLELWFRQPLVEANSQPARLTPAGKEFLEVATRVVHELRAARPAFTVAKSPPPPISGANIRID